jgi:hypothetical protein
MQELYKYCKSEHMEALFDKGSLRIGHLFGWRSSKQSGEMVKDTEDGRIALTGNVVFYDPGNINFLIVDSDPVVVTGSGAEQKRHFKSTMLRCDDVYTFSTASTYSEEDHRRWLDKEGYDACYKIVSIFDFLAAIYLALGDSCFVLCGNACYYDENASNNVFEGTFHPALLKRKAQYGDQNEVRFIWEPEDNAAVRKTISGGPVMEGTTHNANAHRLSKLSTRDIIARGIDNSCVRHRRISA